MQPNGQVAPGLRILNLDMIRGNIVTGNAGAGMNIDLGQNTTFDGTITANTISSNGRAGINLIAKDTQNAFDLQVGGDTIDNQNNFSTPTSWMPTKELESRLRWTIPATCPATLRAGSAF